MPTPLSLECVCEGDLTAQTCTLDQLLFRANCYFEGDYGMVSGVRLDFTYGPSHTPSNVGTSSTGEFTAVLPLDIDWGSLSLTISGTSDSFQPPDSGKYALFFATYSILQTYICIDPVTGSATRREVVSYPELSDCCGCPTDEIFPNRVVATPNTVTLYTSSRLGTCCPDMVGVGAQCVETVWRPMPEDKTINFAAHDFCLCPEGGSPPYHFFIAAGELPCGQKLDADTGCTTGSSDGTCSGSMTVTFGVVDQAGDTATVECNLLGDCNSLKPTIGNLFL